MKAGRKILLAILALDTAAFLFGFSEALVRAFSGAVTIIGRFRLEWAFLEGLSFMTDYSVIAQALAIAIVFSLLDSPVSTTHTGRVLAKSLSSALVFSCALCVYSLFFLPQSRASADFHERESVRFTSAYENGMNAVARGDIKTAGISAHVCDTIDRFDPKAVELSEAFKRAGLAHSPEPGGTAASDEPVGPVETEPLPEETDPREKGKKANAFYMEALGFFEKQDWYSAHYWATKAFEIDPSRTDAQRLASEAWNAISSGAPPLSEREASDAYKSKNDAYLMLMSGEYLDAYRAFLALSKNGTSTDPDIKKYLAESLEHLKESAFFSDEFETARISSSHGFFFADLGGIDETDTYLIADDTHITNGAVFFEGLEYVVVSAGRITKHAKAQYAKLAQDDLALRMIDSKDAQAMYDAEWITGDAPVPVPWLIEAVPTDNETIATIILARGSIRTVPLSVLFSASDIGARYGIDTRWLRMETLDRIGYAFALLVSALAATVIGFRLVWKGLPMPKSRLILVPVIGFAAWVVMQVSGASSKAVISVLVSSMPYIAALWVWIGGLSAISLVLFIVLLGQRSHEEPS